MRALNKAGLFCVGFALIIGAVVFIHFNGLNEPAYAVGRMVSSAFWGGLSLFALFSIIMAVLFLSA